jgi:hypothetical protein
MEYKDPKPAFERLKSCRKYGTNREIRNVCPKLEVNANRMPKDSNDLLELKKDPDHAFISRQSYINAVAVKRE